MTANAPFEQTQLHYTLLALAARIGADGQLYRDMSSGGKLYQPIADMFPGFTLPLRRELAQCPQFRRLWDQLPRPAFTSVGIALHLSVGFHTKVVWKPVNT